MRWPSVVHKEWRPLLLFAVILIFGAWAFFEIVEDMVWGDPFVAADHATFTALQTWRTPARDQVMITLTECGDTLVVWGVAVAVAAWLAWRRAWRPLVYWALAVGGGSLINTAIKLALHRARPTDLHYTGASLYSFPSGHSTTNAVLYGFLIILLARQWPLRRVAPIAVGLVLFVGAIAFSRLYLGAHWLSDVGGGLIFGAAWLALLGMLYVLRPAPSVDPAGLLRTAALALVVAAGADIALHHRADLRTYAPAAPAAIQAGGP